MPASVVTVLWLARVEIQGYLCANRTVVAECKQCRSNTPHLGCEISGIDPQSCVDDIQHRENTLKLAKNQYSGFSSQELVKKLIE